MGIGHSQDGSVQQLFEFRQFENDQEGFEIPEKPENRRVTDRKYWIAFIVVLIALIPFVVYTLLNVQLKQIYGSDNCGNFCGYKNEKYDDWKCTGKDYTDKPYQKLEMGTYLGYNNEWYRLRSCVSSCPDDYQVFLQTCLPSDESRIKNSKLSMEAVISFLGDVGRDILRGSWAILMSTVITCLLCFGTMYLFRYHVKEVVWFILIGSIGLLAILAGLCWYFFLGYAENEDYLSNSTYEQRNAASVLLAFALVLTICVIFLICMVTCMMKRVQLIIQLFKEASKAICDIPSMILMPVWVSILVTICVVVFIVLCLFMFMSAKLVQVGLHRYEYMMTPVMITAIFYNIFTYVWVMEFIMGAQYMIIAGAVSSWFFSRNKQYLKGSLWTSFTNFTNFHLGTVAIGSLIVTIITIIRNMIKAMSRRHQTRWLVDCCLKYIEEFLRYLSKNAYIQTAMHGQSFFKSGKRAADLLVSNASNVIAVNSIGDFVLFMARLLLVLICGGIGCLLALATGVTNYWAITLICTVIAAIMARAFFAVLEATIDSIFLCFCEDTILNDGMARPYFMSKGLMQFIEDTKSIRVKE